MTAPPSLTLQSQVRVSDDVLFQELDGEAVLLNLKSGTYFGLNEVGTTVWRLIASGSSIPVISKCIRDEYDVEPPADQFDLMSFLAQLSAASLIEIA